MNTKPLEMAMMAPRGASKTSKPIAALCIPKIELPRHFVKASAGLLDPLLIVDFQLSQFHSLSKPFNPNLKVSKFPGKSKPFNSLIDDSESVRRTPGISLESISLKENNAGMVWETILAEFPDIEGKTVLAAIALPLPSLLTTPRLSHNRQVHLIHHADDRLCVWKPSNQDMRLLQHQGFTITHITGWRAYLGTAQHNYPHWTRVTLPEGRQDIAKLESSPGVLPLRSIHKPRCV